MHSLSMIIDASIYARTHGSTYVLNMHACASLLIPVVEAELAVEEVADGVERRPEEPAAATVAPPPLVVVVVGVVLRPWRRSVHVDLFGLNHHGRPRAILWNHVRRWNVVRRVAAVVAVGVGAFAVAAAAAVAVGRAVAIAAAIVAVGRALAGPASVAVRRVVAAAAAVAVSRVLSAAAAAAAIVGYTYGDAAVVIRVIAAAAAVRVLVVLAVFICLLAVPFQARSREFLAAAGCFVLLSAASIPVLFRVGVTSAEVRRSALPGR
jgi:hypothetical protein